LNVSATHFIPARQGLEIDVSSERRPQRMQLHLPNLRAFCLPWHFKEDVCTNPSLERRIEVRREVRGEDHYAAVPLELLQQDVYNAVRFALKAVID
jgi:hypothetical protein